MCAPWIITTRFPKPSRPSSAVFAPKWSGFWARIGATIGAEGLPNYTDVPGEVNVTEILRLWTYAKSLDLVVGEKCATI